MDVRIDLVGNELAGKFGKRFAAASLVIMGAGLDRVVQELVSLRASQINGCGVCVDMHTKELGAAGESAVRINMVAAWRDSNVFSDGERAALALAEEGTRLADNGRGVSDETWGEVRKHFDEDQVVALVGVVAMINAANRINVITHQVGGNYEAGMLDAMA
ncbi:carboxymuconolactone decarboxylase family protein [Nocardia sp. NPDC020380]|uniref:carboxymuconolactone decarboxylase family protein n=1 Tax=Nocardia sp. NPDC020380 TaxID=3364309 RepID=UPI0037992251